VFLALFASTSVGKCKTLAATFAKVTFPKVEKNLRLLKDGGAI
jgi:hypothetical protein